MNSYAKPSADHHAAPVGAEVAARHGRQHARLPVQHLDRAVTNCSKWTRGLFQRFAGPQLVYAADADITRSRS